MRGGSCSSGDCNPFALARAPWVMSKPNTSTDFHWSISPNNIDWKKELSSLLFCDWTWAYLYTGQIILWSAFPVYSFEGKWRRRAPSVLFLSRKSFLRERVSQWGLGRGKLYYRQKDFTVSWWYKWQWCLFTMTKPLRSLCKVLDPLCTKGQKNDFEPNRRSFLLYINNVNS